MAPLRVTRDAGVARLTFDHPPLNVLTPALVAELDGAVRELAGDPALRVVVLAGQGRAFSAGVEVQALRDLDPARARSFIEALERAIRGVRDLDVPVVARLHGHVLGGALELALGCDLRLAAASCRLGMPEVTVGIPSVIEAALLPGLVGWGRATELLLGGGTIDGVEAERWGLVNRAVPDAGLDEEVARWVARLVALPPRAVRLQKGLLRRWRAVDVETAIADSKDAFAEAYATDEPRRRMTAFLERPRER